MTTRKVSLSIIAFLFASVLTLATAWADNPGGTWRWNLGAGLYQDVSFPENVEVGGVITITDWAGATITCPVDEVKTYSTLGLVRIKCKIGNTTYSYLFGEYGSNQTILCSSGAAGEEPGLTVLFKQN